ncbi:MAG TPA: Ran-binding zinc finger domain-containing protein [Longimicrobium sp.]
MAIREGRWDCPSCGSKAQLGRHVYCIGCGAPRPKEIRFYLPEDAEAVTDAGQLAQAAAGADWVCEHCGGSARATDVDCPGCGAPRGSSAERQVHEYDTADIPRAGGPPADAPRRAMQPPPSTTRPARRSHFGRNVFLTLLVAVLGWFGWSNRTRHVEGVVTAKQWERSVQVEAYRTVTEEGWDLPQGGRLVRSYRAIRDYRRVLDHYETRTRQVSDRVQTGTESYTCGSVDRGNGYFEDRTCTRPVYETRYHTETYQEPIYRREPIWDTKYEYRIKRWVPDQLLTERGDTTQPRWPATEVDDTTREGEKKQRYVITFRDGDGDSYSPEVPLDQFTGHRVGEHVPLKVNGSRAQIDTAASH